MIFNSIWTNKEVKDQESPFKVLSVSFLSDID